MSSHHDNHVVTTRLSIFRSYCMSPEEFQLLTSHSFCKIVFSTIGKSNLLTDLICPYTDVCIALYTRCFLSVCEKNFTGDSGGIRTHDLLLTSAVTYYIKWVKRSTQHVFYEALIGRALSQKIISLNNRLS